MKKIPTLFRRDPADQDRLLREVHPACLSVILLRREPGATEWEEAPQ